MQYARRKGLNMRNNMHFDFTEGDSYKRVRRRFPSSRIGMTLHSLGRWPCSGRRVVPRTHRFAGDDGSELKIRYILDLHGVNLVSNIFLYGISYSWNRFFAAHCGVLSRIECKFPGGAIIVSAIPSTGLVDSSRDRPCSSKLWLSSMPLTNEAIVTSPACTFGSRKTCFALPMIAESCSSGFSHLKFFRTSKLRA